MESKTLRRRVNVATSVRGVVTWDCTVEGEGYTQAELLAESDSMVKALKERYPIAPEQEKPTK